MFSLKPRGLGRAATLLLAFVSTAMAQESRTWTARNGQTFTARLLACDAVRATLDVEGRGKLPVQLAALSAPDVEYVTRWRAANPKAPLIDPAALAPWPAQTAVAVPAVQSTGENAAAKSFTWESARYRFQSDQKLALGVIRELATLLEGTRELLLQLPLGLHAGGEREKYAVRMFQRPVDFLYNGGGSGNSVFWNGRELLLLLANLGIKPSSNTLSVDAQSLYALKHEATRQLLRGAGWTMPAWLEEGLGGCVASWPHGQGRYALKGLDPALRGYLVKGRKPSDRTPLRIIVPAKLMELTAEEWRKDASGQESPDRDPSATLLTYYFLFVEGRGEGAVLAAYLNALHTGAPPEEAETTHLLKARSRADLAAELHKMGRRVGVEFAVE
jgi:hypothetical protein